MRLDTDTGGTPAGGTTMRPATDVPRRMATGTAAPPHGASARSFDDDDDAPVSQVDGVPLVVLTDD